MLFSRNSSDPQTSNCEIQQTCLCALVPEEDERREPGLGRTNDRPNKEGVRQSVKYRTSRDRVRIENLVSSPSISSRPLSHSSRSHDHVLRFRVCHRWQDSSPSPLSHVQGRGSRSSPRYTIACKKEAGLIHPSPQERLHYLPHHVFQVELDAAEGARPR